MSDDDRYVTEALVAFAKSLPDTETVEDVLRTLGDFCTELLPVDGVGVLLRSEGGLTVATTNSPEGQAIEELEVDLGEGPCIEAVQVEHPILVPDLEEASERYPRFVPRAIDAGVRAVHALPLVGHGERIGALDVMSRTPRHLSQTEAATAQMLADVAVSYITTVRMHEDSTRLASQLSDALDSRVVIEQAKGILAERHGESFPDAFARLRSHARSSNQKLRDVAQDVVDGVLEL